MIGLTNQTKEEEKERERERDLGSSQRLWEGGGGKNPFFQFASIVSQNWDKVFCQDQEC